MNTAQLERLLTNLRGLTGEREWLEFKENNESPEMIGETVAALSNSARLLGEPCSDLVWGVRDGTREIVGTSFRPGASHKGNEELEHWLVRLLTPQLHLHFHQLDIDGQHIVMPEIPAAPYMPVQFPAPSSSASAA